MFYYMKCNRSLIALLLYLPFLISLYVIEASGSRFDEWVQLERDPLSAALGPEATPMKHNAGRFKLDHKVLSRPALSDKIRTDSDSWVLEESAADNEHQDNALGKVSSIFKQGILSGGIGAGIKMATSYMASGVTGTLGTAATAAAAAFPYALGAVGVGILGGMAIDKLVVKKFLSAETQKENSTILTLFSSILTGQFVSGSWLASIGGVLGGFSAFHAGYGVIDTIMNWVEKTSGKKIPYVRSIFATFSAVGGGMIGSAAATPIAHAVDKKFTAFVRGPLADAAHAVCPPSPPRIHINFAYHEEFGFYRVATGNIEALCNYRGSAHDRFVINNEATRTYAYQDRSCTATEFTGNGGIMCKGQGCFFYCHDFNNPNTCTCLTEFAFYDADAPANDCELIRSRVEESCNDETLNYFCDREELGAQGSAVYPDNLSLQNLATYTNASIPIGVNAQITTCDNMPLQNLLNFEQDSSSFVKCLPRESVSNAVIYPASEPKENLRGIVGQAISNYRPDQKYCGCNAPNVSPDLRNLNVVEVDFEVFKNQLLNLGSQDHANGNDFLNEASRSIHIPDPSSVSLSFSPNTWQGKIRCQMTIQDLVDTHAVFRTCYETGNQAPFTYMPSEAAYHDNIEQVCCSHFDNQRTPLSSSTENITKEQVITDLIEGNHAYTNNPTIQDCPGQLSDIEGVLSVQACNGTRVFARDGYTAEQFKIELKENNAQTDFCNCAANPARDTMMYPEGIPSGIYTETELKRAYFQTGNDPRRAIFFQNPEHTLIIRDSQGDMISVDIPANKLLEFNSRLTCNDPASAVELNFLQLEEDLPILLDSIESILSETMPSPSIPSETTLSSSVSSTTTTPNIYDPYPLLPNEAFAIKPQANLIQSEVDGIHDRVNITRESLNGAVFTTAIPWTVFFSVFLSKVVNIN